METKQDSLDHPKQDASTAKPSTAWAPAPAATLELAASPKHGEPRWGEASVEAQYEACVMARDAIHGISASYFIDLDDKETDFDEHTGLWRAKSVWSGEHNQLKLATLIKSPRARSLFKYLAFALLFTAMFEKPRIWNQIPYWVGSVAAALILAVFWVVFALKMWCISARKHLWFKGASEEVWTMLLGVCLVCSTIGVILQTSDTTEIETISGKIEFHRADLWLRVVRSYYLVYFSPAMRSGILSTFRIFWDLRAVFGLIIVCFLVHYFAYEAAMGTEDTDSAGLTQWQRNLGAPSGEAKDGLWNMFILLTTANHPDIVMEFYNASPISILLLLSFMFTTFYFLMNLLLGVVYSAYQACYSSEIKANKLLKSAILSSAFHKLKVTVVDDDGDIEEGVDYKGFVRAVAFIQGENKAEFDGEWFDVRDAFQLQTYVTKIEEVLGTPDRHKAPISRVWFDMLDSDGSGTVEPEEFQRLATVMNAPLQRVENKQLTAITPVFPKLHSIFVSGTIADCRPDDVNQRNPESVCFAINWCNFVNLIVVLNVICVVFADRHSFCHTWALGFEIVWVGVYVLDVVFRILAEGTTKNMLAFFFKPSNLVDLVSTGLLLGNLSACSHGDQAWLRVAGTMLRVLRLGYTVHQLEKIGAIVKKVLSLVVPQFTVFVMVYFFFATVGMALFAGDTTKTVATGGPGDWSTAPWSSSSYGSASYYYAINFDNIGRAYFLLFTLMVQNNWNVTADGFEQTNTRWTRLYFLVFNISVVMVMCNIFIASVMQYYSDLDKDDKELAEEKLKGVCDLLHATEFSVADSEEKSCWFVVMEIKDDSQLNAGDEEESRSADKEEAKQYSKNELTQNRGMLNDLPIPVCIQEANGTYTWANTKYKEIVIPERTLNNEKARAAAIKKAKNIETRGDIILNGQNDTVFLEREELGELRVRKIKEMLAQDVRDTAKGIKEPLETQHSERHGQSRENPAGDKYCAVMLPIDLLKLNANGTPIKGAVLFLLPSKKSYRSKALDFLSLDRNKSNTISLDEWLGRFGDSLEARAAFDKYDTDGDRMISKAEFIARDEAKTKHARTHPGRSTRVKEALTGPSSTFAAESQKGLLKGQGSSFDQADLNRDGKIDHDEFIQRHGTDDGFDGFDTDKDGQIDKEEARATLLKLFNDADKNNSGSIDGEELLAIFSHFQVNPESLDVVGNMSALELTKQIVKDYGVASATEFEDEEDEERMTLPKLVLDFEQFYLMVDENDFWPELGLVLKSSQLSQTAELKTVGDVRRVLIKLFDEYDLDGDLMLEEDEVYYMFEGHSDINIHTMPDGQQLIEDLIDVFGVSKACHLHFNEFAQALITTSWPPSDPKPLCEAFGIKLPVGLNSQLVYKMPRYRPGTEKNEFNKLPWYRRMQASMFVRDATHNMTGTYYERSAYNKTTEGVSTIWADDPTSLEWMQLLRSGEYRTFFKIISFSLVFATCLERPGMWSEIPTGVGSAIVIFCLLAIWVVVWVYCKCMWPCRDRWWRGSSEEYWLCGMLIALPLATFGVFYDIADGDLESIQTIFGTVDINRTAMALKVTRAYFVLFFSPTMRSNFLSSLAIFNRIRHIVALIVIFFLVHYLAFVAVMSENQYQLNIGMPDGFVPDGLWNFFVTLTTANHPDLVMNLYQSDQLSGLILVSFMALSFYFLMSLLLGVVCSAYNDIYAAACESEQRMEHLILLEAFEMTKTKNPKTALNLQVERLTAEAACIRYAGDRANQPLLETDGSRAVDKNGAPRNVRRPGIFFHGLAPGTSTRLFERELARANVEIAKDSEGLADIFLPRDHYGKALGEAMVFTRESPSKHQLRLLKQQFGNPDLYISVDNKELPALEHKAWELKCEAEEEEWGMDFHTFSEIVSLYGDGKGDNAELISVWFDMMDMDGSGYIDYTEFKDVKKVLNSPLERRDIATERLNDSPACPSMHKFAITSRMGEPGTWLGLVGWESIVDTMTLVAVIWTVWVPPHDICEEAYGFTIEMFWTLLFVADAIVTPLGLARKLDYWVYFKLWYRNLDVLAAIGMVASMGLCATDGSIALRKVIGLVRCLRTFRLTYSVDALRTIVRCAQKVLILILPQLTMFVVVYYTFAVIGMAFFAGDVTRTVATGGPGDWSTAPWASTGFGSAAYYYRLNFDNLGNSFITLFTLMVVNNWGVTVNGYEETSDASRWVRVYFFTVHIVLVWIYINVFISTIISYYDMFLEDEVDPESSLIAKTLTLANERLAATRHRKGWVVLNILEDNRTLFAGNSNDDASAKAVEAALKAREKLQCRRILRFCPLPMFIMTSNGKFTFANDAYLTLEGLEREVNPATGIKFEDSPLKGLKEHPDKSKRVPKRAKARSKQREIAMQDSCMVTFEEDYHLEGFVGLETMTAHSRPCTLLSGLPGALTYLTAVKIYDHTAPTAAVEQAPEPEAQHEEAPKQVETSEPEPVAAVEENVEEQF